MVRNKGKGHPHPQAGAGRDCRTLRRCENPVQRVDLILILIQTSQLLKNKIKTSLRQLEKSEYELDTRGCYKITVHLLSVILIW